MNPSTIVVGISDLRCSNQPGRTLVTYGLGSCIAIGMHDPVAHVGGLLHFMLPDSKMDPVKARQNPAMFADTGIPLLLEAVEHLGADKRRLKVRIAGGAQMIEGKELFHIGKRNYLAARKSLWQMGLLLEMEAVGGNTSRTLGLDVGQGQFWVRSSSNPDSDADSCAPMLPTQGGRL